MKLAKTVGPSTKVNFGAFVTDWHLRTWKAWKWPIILKIDLFLSLLFTEILIYWIFCSETSEKIRKQTLYYVIISKQKAISLVYGC